MVKPPQKIKKLVGGLLALGIFLFLATFGNSDLFGYIEKLKTDIFGAMPIITSIYPDSGTIGDLIYVEGNGLGETVEENILKFGDTEVAIASVELESDGNIRIVATVPDLLTGEYRIELETPTGTAFNAESSEIFTILDSEIIDDEKEVAEDKIDELVVDDKEDSETTINDEVDEILVEIQNELDVKNESAAETSDFELFAENSPLGVQLRWEYPTAANFAIFYGSRSEEYLHLLSGKSSPTFLSNLAAGQQYFFKVIALDTAGNEVARSAETTLIAAAVTAVISTTTSTTSADFIHASATPERLSEEGPAEMLAITILVALGISGILFRRKVGARK